MRRPPSSWNTLLTQLGFRRVKKTPSRREKVSRIEQLEKRELLTTNVGVELAWEETLATAPTSFSVGHFTLTSADWSGKTAGGSVLATGRSLGVDSKQPGTDPSAFDAGESWSFNLSTSGRLMGIQFDQFSVGDADRAQLIIGDRSHAISAADLVEGYWRPSEEIAFQAGQTLQLVALPPTLKDLQQAMKENLSLQSADANFVGPVSTTPKSVWKLVGVTVIGETDAKLGGFIPVVQNGPSETTQSGEAEEAPSSLEETPWPTVAALMGADVAITSFTPDPSDPSKLRIGYNVTGPVTNFYIKIYRALNFTGPDGNPALVASAEITGNIVGNGQFVSLAVNLGSDLVGGLKRDDYLMAVVEFVGGVTDDDINNNKRLFDGGAFKDGSTGIVYYLAANSATNDLIRIASTGGANPTYQVLQDQGSGYVPIFQGPAFSEIHVRTYGGHDRIEIVDPLLNVRLWAFGGAGNDTIVGGAGNDYLSGGANVDIISGLGGSDEINGGSGLGGLPGSYYGDLLYGGAGADRIYGEAGPDYIDGGTEGDILYGGDELDGYGGYYQGYGDWLIGGDGDDLLFAGYGDDAAYGGGGDDILYGSSGNDNLWGNAGNDILFQNSGSGTVEWIDGQPGVHDPLVVRTLADESETQGTESFGIADLSLREAIAAASLQAGNDTIVFASGVVGEIELSSTYGQLVLTSPLTISGPGATSLTIDANANASSLRRIFTVNSGVNATISGVTLTGGYITGTNYGGAILVNGNLTIDSAVLSGNQAGLYGGAVYTSATGKLRVLDTTFKQNTASSVGSQGGAIRSDSNLSDSLVIERSAFVSNEAKSGGGIYLDGNNGGVGTATIVSSTFSDNKALSGGGGAIGNGSGSPPLTIRSSTIAYNSSTSAGGGISMHHVDETHYTLHNTIVAHNDSINTTDENIKEELNSASSYNLIGVGGTGGLSNTQGNQINVAVAGLLPLAYTNGGLTPTHGLKATSVAIDAGLDAEAKDAAGNALTVDQRGVGYIRIYDDPSEPNVNGSSTVVDIGAFEYFGQFQWREAEFTSSLTPATGGAPNLDVVGDLTASGSRLLSVFETGNSSVASPPTSATASIAQYNVSVEKTGDFRLWMRVVAPNDDANSLWWRIDGGTWTQWTPASEPGWRWLTVASGITLTSGTTHSLELASGKDGIQIDKFLLTDNVNPYSAQNAGIGPGDSVTPSPSVITLPITLRDFHSSSWTPPLGSTSLPHPDFQHLSPNSTATTGLVQTSLSLGNPVMASAQTQLSSADNFRQWYYNVPAYNRTSQLVSRIVADPTRPGVYQFVGSFGAAGDANKVGTTHEFFPLDGAQFGATGTSDSETQLGDNDASDRESDEVSESHNYGFTAEIRADFTYVPGQTINVLEATDDLWIFIDGRLFIDLGGAHQAVGQSRSLDNFGLVAGKRYSFDLFAANRSTSDDSLLVWETNIGDLTPAIRLIEDDRLVTQLDGMFFIVPPNPTTMRLNFYNLGFDGSAANGADMRDAFEIAVLKSDGTSALPTISPSSDAVFNITHGQMPVWSSGVGLIDKVGSNYVGVTPVAGISSGIVQIDISSLTPGTAIRVVPRLINNDVDNLSSVTIGTLGILGQGTFAPASGIVTSPLVAASNPETPRIQPGVDFEQLADVTRSFNVVHQHTSIDRANNANQIDQIIARLDLSKLAGAQQVRGDLLLAVTEIVGQSTHTGDGTQLAKFDGRLPRAVAGLPAGTPYIRLSSLLTTTDGYGYYVDGALAAAIELAFSHPGTAAIPNGRFDFKVVLLGELNAPPAFVSDPYAGFRGNAYPVDFVAALSAAPRRSLEIVANGDNTLTYKPILKDPNGDHVEIKLIAGPPAVAGDSSGVNPGPTMEAVDLDHDGFAETLQWKPTSAQKGTYRIQLRAVDEFGAFDPANDQFIDIRVIEPVANRPPQFTTPPKVDAFVGKPYSYDADAFDPDDKQLYFRATNEAAPLANVQQFVVPLASLIPTGQSSATFSHLTFVNDNDAGTSHGVSQFSNIRIYETDGNGQPQILKFDLGRFAAVAGKDGDGTVRVGGDGSIVRLTENAWKQYLLDMPYKVTPKTVIAFTFASEEEGERHAIGLSAGSSTSGKWFQVYGSEGASAESANGDLSISGDAEKRYDAAWSTNFHVDSLTGKVTWTPPKEAVGQWVHVDLHVRDRELETAAETKTDRQEYDIYVAADPQNSWPIITSKPVKHHELPDGVAGPSGIVDVVGDADDRIELNLEPGESTTVQVRVRHELGDFIPPFLLDSALPEANKLTVRGREYLINETIVANSAAYDTLLADILTQGGATGVHINSINVQDGTGNVQDENENTVYRSGVFQNGTGENRVYRMDDYGLVLSTGNPEDYGHLASPPGDTRKSTPFNQPATAAQELLLDKITDQTIPIVITVQDPVPGQPGVFKRAVQSFNLTSDNFWSNTNGSPSPFGPAFNGVLWEYVNDQLWDRDPADVTLIASPQILYHPTNNPNGLRYDPENSRIVYTPEADEIAAQPYEVTLTIDTHDTRSGIQTLRFVLPVLANNPPLTFSSTPTNDGVVTQDFDPVTSDPYDDFSFFTYNYTPTIAETLSTNAVYSLNAEALSRGVSINSTTGEISWRKDLPPGVVVSSSAGIQNLPHFDVTELNLRFTVDPGTTRIGFNVVFGSEEFPEFLGSNFIDAFGIFAGTTPNPIQNIATWQNQPVNINHENVAAAGSITPGTELNGLLYRETPGSALNARIPFEVDLAALGTPDAQGNYYLTFIIADSGDSALDSTAYITGLGAVPAGPADILLEDQPDDSTVTSIIALDIDQSDAVFFNLEPARDGDPASAGWATYNVTITGDGADHAYDLRFIDAFGAGYDFGSIPVTINKDYFYLVTAQDEDNDLLTFSLPVAPEGAVIDQASGQIHWAPPHSTGAVAYDFVVRVEDGRGGFDEQRYSVTVSPDLTNSTPTKQDPGPQEARITVPFELQINASDPNPAPLNPDPLRFYLQPGAPEGMSINVNTGLISWTPKVSQKGWLYEDVTVKVYDYRGGVATVMFDVQVLEETVYVNAQPEIDPIGDDVVLAGERFTIDVNATDSNKDPIRFDLPLRPSGMSIDRVTGVIAWDPTYVHEGVHTVMVRAQDGNGGIGVKTFKITVVDPNHDPEITSKPSGPAKAGALWSYDVVADDEDDDVLSYEVFAPSIPTLLGGAPAITIDQLGHLVWTPPAGTTGEFPVHVFVRDGKGGEDRQSFILPVTIGNTRPKITATSGPPVFEGESWSILLDVSDSETSDHASIDVRPDDYGQSLGLETEYDGVAGKWRLKWDNPPSAGSYTVIVTAVDPDNASTPLQLTLPVNARPSTNTPPEFLPVNIPAATANKPWSLTLTARDLRLGDQVQIQAVKPSWLSAIGGALTATETSITLSAASVPADLESFQFSATASDNYGNSRTATITVPVIPNHRPIIVGMRTMSPPQLNQTTDIELKVVDFDGDNVRFELVSPSPGVSPGLAAPVAASADPRNPTVVVLPFTPMLEGQRKLTVRVIDQDGASSEATIDLDIFDPTNDPPDVSLLTPTTLFTGEEMNVSVTGPNPDQDGDFLTYALLDALGNRVTRIEGSTRGGGLAPTGLSIDPQTGRLHWKPTPEQELSTLDADYTFTVQVSDGRHLVELGPAKLRVVAPPAANSAPMFVLGPANARLTSEQSVDLQFAVFDYDVGSTLTVTASGPVSGNDGFLLPGGGLANSLSIAASNNPDQPSTFTYHFDADLADIGDRTLTITVTDNTSKSTTYSVPLTIRSPGVVNSLPSLSLKARDVAAANETFVAQASSVDADGGTPRFALLQGTERVTKITSPYPAPTGMSIDPVTGRITWTPSTGDIRPEEYSYTVVVDDDDTAANGEAKLTDVKVRVVNRLTNEVPQITSTFSELNMLGNGSLSYPAIATDKDNDPITWSLISGPKGASIDPLTGVFSWTPGEGDVGKDFEAVIQASDPFNGASQQGLSWMASAIGATGNNAPDIYSTPPQPGKAGEMYHYLVRARDLDGERIKITASGASVLDNGDGTAVVSLTLSNAQQTFKVTATDARGLSTEQSVAVTGGAAGGGTSGVVDTPPDIKSRPPLSVSKDGLYYHKIIVHDPDVQIGVQTSQISYSLVIRNAAGVALTLPNGAFDAVNGIINWSPSDNGINSATVVDVVIGATQHGVTTTLSYRLQIIDPGVGNTPPVLQPESGLKSAPGQVFKYDVKATDAQNDALTYFLVDDDDNLVSEYAGFAITPDGRVSWSVPAGAHLIGETRTFRVHVQDVNLKPVSTPLGPDTADFTVTIQQDEPPTVSLAASTFRPTPGEVIGFTVLAADDLGTPDVRVRLEGLPTSWELSGFKELMVGSNGVALYTVPANAQAGVTFTAKATAVDGGGNSVSSAAIEFRVRDVDTGYPVIAINSPVLDDDALAVKTATPIQGRLYDPDGVNNLAYYSVTARPLDGGAPVILKKVGNPNSQTGISDVGSAGVDGLIVNLSPMDLANGAYEIEIQAQDIGGKSSSEFFSIIVESDVKLGNFALSFTDMTIPVAGFPITVQRSYDTLDAKTKGDFGYGWSLDVFSGKLEVALSDNPENSFWKGFGYQPAIKYGSAITLTLPGGETQSFTAIPVPIDDASVEGGSAGGALGLANLFAIAFQPALGQQTRLDLVGGGSFNYPSDFYNYLPEHLASEPFGSIQVAVDLGTEDEPGTFEFRALSAGATSGLGIPFNPATPGDMPGLDYRLTLPDGTQYVFDSATGKLISAKDPQDNRLEISDTSIRAISKDNAEMAGITITRENGLIKTIKDSAGHELNYQYLNGELVRFWDRATSPSSTPTSTYRYGETTNSPSIPLELLQHRLTSIDNAYGTTVLQVGYNGDGRISKIVDGAEHSAVITYEDPNLIAYPALAGAVKIEVIKDAYQNPTELVRDGNGNILRRIERTGADIYSVTVTEYDAENRPIVEYQPFVESGTGRYGVVPAATPKTTTRYTPEGRLWEVTDPLNKTTRYEYDPDGNLKNVEDPRGKKTINDYVDGLLVRTVDATGNITEFDYLYGQLIGTRQIDDQGRRVSESYFTYDFAGRLTSSTDTSNVTKYFVYDEVGNQTLSYSHWVNPNSSADVRTVVTRTVYDGENREKSTKQYTFNVKRDFVSADELDLPTVVTPDWSTSTDYDKAGRVAKTVDRFQTATYHLYDSRGNLVETRTSTDTPNVWVVTRTAYDQNGRAVAVSDPFVVQNSVAPSNETDFNPTGPGGDVLLNANGGTGNAGDYRVSTTEYDPMGRAIFARRISGTPVVLVKEANGVYITTFADGTPSSTEETKYDDRGRVFQTKNVDGVITQYGYDAADRQQSVTVDPANEFGLNSTTYFFYDDAGRQTRIVAQISTNPPAFDPATYDYRDYQVIDYEYDDAGRLERTILRGDRLVQTDDVVTKTIYDAMGRRKAEIDPLGRRTEYVYDVKGRLERVILPTVRDADPNSPTVNQDVNPDYLYGYDDYGNQISSRDPKGRVTKFTFDELNRQTGRVLPMGVDTTQLNTDFIESMQYFAGGMNKGLLEKTTDFEGRTTTYTYDSLGRVATKTHVFEGVTRLVTYSYDKLGRVTYIDEQINGAPAQFTDNDYDAEGRLTRVANNQGVVGYQYHAVSGRLIRTITRNVADTADRASTRYDYDKLGRLEKVTVEKRGGSNVVDEDTTYKYDKLNRIDYQIDRIAGTTSSVTKDTTYDALGRVDKIDHFVDSASGDGKWTNGEKYFASFDYLYDLVGNRTQAIEKIDGNNDGIFSTAETQQFDWEYDRLNRLITESFDKGAVGVFDAGDYVDRYSFDLSINRVSKTRDLDANHNTAEQTIAYNYDRNDRLTQETATGGANAYSTSYSYGSGNSRTQVTQKQTTLPGSITETITYVYDERGQLKTSTVAKTNEATVVTDYKYDDSGIRVSQKIGSTTTLYLIDAQNPTGYSQVFEEGNEASGGNGKIDDAEVVRTYALGYDLLTQANAVSQGGQVLHFLYDAHGSTRALVELSGGASSIALSSSVRQIYSYDAYGNLLNFATTPATSYLYSGEQTDLAAKTKQQYLRARYYDPTNGRFNRLDPHPGTKSDPVSLHKYLYASGSPINLLDPSGLFSLTEVNVSINNMLNLGNQALRVVRSVDTALDAFRTTFEIIRLLRGDIFTTVRDHLETISTGWRQNANPSWRTLLLFREDFWEDAAQVLLTHSGEILTRIISSQGRQITTHLNSLSSSQFRWVIYMPSPAESQLPNPLLRLRLPGLKILDRSVMLHFGPPGHGRLFGLGFEKKREWQSQFFRMDYHEPHDHNWVVRGTRYDFNFHTDRFHRDPI